MPYKLKVRRTIEILRELSKYIAWNLDKSF